MAEGFGNIQKIVDEEMNEDGSDMCHILKLVAMAIFSQRGGSELGPSSPEEKLRLVADLVSSELQGMLKQHKAAPMGEQPGQGEELEILVVIGTGGCQNSFGARFAGQDGICCDILNIEYASCLLYTSPSPRD